MRELWLSGWVSVLEQVSRNNFKTFLALWIPLVSGCRVVPHLRFCDTLCQVLRALVPVSHHIDLSWMAPVRKLSTIWATASTKTNSYSLYLDFSFSVISRYLLQLPNMEYLKPLCILTWRPTTRPKDLHHDGYPRKRSMLRKDQRFHDFCCGLSFKICFLFQEDYVS